MLWLLPPEGPPPAADTELMLGAGNGPGTGVCVDPEPPLPEAAALEVGSLLATELAEADGTLAVADKAVVGELDRADGTAGH